MKPLELVVAADEGHGIGKGGKLPWRLPGEMAYFKRLTSEARPGLQNAVLMGRKTYESIAPKFRPLAGRRNVVLSRAAWAAEGATTVHTLDEAITVSGEVDHLYVIGGGEVYRQALSHPACARVYLTRVHARFDCDTFLPALDASFARTRSDGPHAEAGLTYSFEVWERSA